MATSLSTTTTTTITTNSCCMCCTINFQFCYIFSLKYLGYFMNFMIIIENFIWKYNIMIISTQRRLPKIRGYWISHCVILFSIICYKSWLIIPDSTTRILTLRGWISLFIASCILGNQTPSGCVFLRERDKMKGRRKRRRRTTTTTVVCWDSTDMQQLLSSNFCLQCFLL